MGVTLFVLFWVLLAVVLVVVGLNIGRRRRGGDAASRSGRAHWYIGFAASVAVFFLAIPILTSIGNHAMARSAPHNDGDFTVAQEHGRELFHKYCGVCHTLAAANAVAVVGPDLDKLRPTKPLILDAIEKGRARGNGAMAADLVVGQDAQDVASFVSKAVGQGGK